MSGKSSDKKKIIGNILLGFAVLMFGMETMSGAVASLKENETFTDTKLAADVEPLEEVIDDLVMEMKQRHISRFRSGNCSMEAGLLLEDIMTNYERVSDHCSNIAAAMIEIQADELDMHRYIRMKVKGNDPYFQEEYLRLKENYVLP